AGEAATDAYIVLGATGNDRRCDAALAPRPRLARSSAIEGTAVMRRGGRVRLLLARLGSADRRPRGSAFRGRTALPARGGGMEPGAVLTRQDILTNLQCGPSRRGRNRAHDRRSVSTVKNALAQKSGALIHVRSGDMVVEALRQMRDNRVRSVLVIDDDVLVG